MEYQDLRIVENPTLVREHALDKLRSAISRGLYPPGMRLVERELCEALGVSRTSVREALRQLQAENLIEVGKRRNITVAIVSSKDAEDIYLMREMLETLAVQRFVALADQLAAWPPRTQLARVGEADRGADEPAQRTGPPGPRGHTQGQARIVRSADELEQQLDRLDLVVVSTPPATHAPLAERALRGGAAVVVDKPFVVDSADGERLISIAREEGQLLTVFQNRRWDGDFLTVRKLLEGAGFETAADEARGFLGWLLHASRLQRPRLPAILGASDFSRVGVGAPRWVTVEQLEAVVRDVPAGTRLTLLASNSTVNDVMAHELGHTLLQVVEAGSEPPGLNISRWPAVPGTTPASWQPPCPSRSGAGEWGPT